MEQEDTQAAAEPTFTPYRPHGQLWVAQSLFCLVAGVVLVVMGLHTAFSYDDSAKLVGGDAYNLQIIATRGMVLVGAGIAAMAASAAYAILSVRTYLVTRFPFG